MDGEALTYNVHAETIGDGQRFAVIQWEFMRCLEADRRTRQTLTRLGHSTGCLYQAQLMAKYRKRGHALDDELLEALRSRIHLQTEAIAAGLVALCRDQLGIPWPWAAQELAYCFEVWLFDVAKGTESNLEAFVDAVPEDLPKGRQPTLDKSARHGEWLWRVRFAGESGRSVARRYGVERHTVEKAIAEAERILSLAEATAIPGPRVERT